MIGLRATHVLIKRELVRQLRQPSRVIASIATPLLIWLFLIGGFSKSIGDLSGSNQTIGPYTIPGIASLTVMFASIFASISLIQDRHDGMLRAALVSPAPKWSIAMSKILSGSFIALLQALIVLFTLPIVGVPISPLGLLGASAALACISIALIGLGLSLAWLVDSTQGFHGVMNAILMPMWLTSGAIFPPENAAGWLKAIALINPLTWAHTAMRSSLSMDTSFNPYLAWSITIAFALFGIMLSISTIARMNNS